MPIAVDRINLTAIKFLNAQNLDEVFKIAVEEGSLLTKATSGTIVLRENGQMSRVYSNSPVSFKTKNRIKGNMIKVFEEKEVIYFKPSTSLKYHKTLREGGIKLSYIIPLSYRGKSIGVLFLDSKREKNASHEFLNGLKLFGSMTTLAIRKYQLIEETKRALELRDLFISLAAHELRTPLTSISVYAQMLEKHFKGRDSVHARWVKELSGETNRLTNIVQELLLASRIKADGQLNYDWEECSLNEIVDLAIKRFKLIHKNRKIIYKNNLDPKKDRLIGDHDKLLQVITNLLDNAFKYSDDEKAIHIQTFYKNSFLVIEVLDEGQGIREDDLPRIFEGFYKGRDNQKQGMGLGLFLSKSIIESHKGEISVSSKLNIGTKIQVKLPPLKTN